MPLSTIFQLYNRGFFLLLEKGRRGRNHMVVFRFSSTIKGVRVMVFNSTFNNISVISWLSVYWCLSLTGMKLETVLTIGTDYIESVSNYL
jgi:hypothetical protein